MRTKFRRSMASLFALGGVIALAACSDPVANEDHVDPVGIVVISGNTDVVTVTGLNITGAFFIAEGGQTDPLRVEFVDDRGNRFVPDEPDEWLRVTVTHPNLATWVEDVPGGWSGTLRGITKGSTTVRFELMHGEVGSASSHPDFGTPGVPLTIN